MQYFDFEGSAVDTQKYGEVRERLRPYIAVLNDVASKGTYDAPENSLNAPVDVESFENITKLAEVVLAHPVQYVFVVGIGGSSLGAKALYQALEDERKEESAPKMIFLEGPDPHTLSSLQKSVLPNITAVSDVLVILISKSGNTTETSANFEWLYRVLYEKCGGNELDLSKRIVVISNKQSPIALLAQEKKWHTLSIPEKVGGRFSVFTAVGLFPLLVAGFDIHTLIQGAREGREQALVFSDNNPYLRRAVTRYLWYTSGYTIETLFPFSSRLRGLAEWYRQLTAESLGKKNAHGESIALLPEIALGPEDLHSIAQLYLGTLRTQSTTFLTLEKVPDILTGNNNVLGLEQIRGKSAGDIVHAIQQGVERAYAKSKKPFMHVVLSDLEPSALGEWMQGTMIETMLLATLFEVNAFDQPDVEQYKTETRAILSSF